MNTPPETAALLAVADAIAHLRQDPPRDQEAVECLKDAIRHLNALHKPTMPPKTANRSTFGRFVRWARRA